MLLLNWLFYNILYYFSQKSLNKKKTLTWKHSNLLLVGNLINKYNLSNFSLLSINILSNLLALDQVFICKIHAFSQFY